MKTNLLILSVSLIIFQETAVLEKYYTFFSNVNIADIIVLICTYVGFIIVFVRRNKCNNEFILFTSISCIYVTFLIFLTIINQNVKQSFDYYSTDLKSFVILAAMSLFFTLDKNELKDILKKCLIIIVCYNLMFLIAYIVKMEILVEYGSRVASRFDFILPLFIYYLHRNQETFRSKKLNTIFYFVAIILMQLKLMVSISRSLYAFTAFTMMWMLVFDEKRNRGKIIISILILLFFVALVFSGLFLSGTKEMMVDRFAEAFIMGTETPSTVSWKNNAIAVFDLIGQNDYIGYGIGKIFPVFRVEEGIVNTSFIDSTAISIFGKLGYIFFPFNLVLLIFICKFFKYNNYSRYLSIYLSYNFYTSGFLLNYRVGIMIAAFIAFILFQDEQEKENKLTPRASFKQNLSTYKVYA